MDIRLTCKCFPLFQRDTRCQSIPVLPYQLREAEHDLLSRHDAGVPPCRKGLFGTLDSRAQFCFSALRHACHQIVGCRIVQINISARARLAKLVVDKVWRVLNILDACMRRGIALRRRRGARGGSNGILKLRGHLGDGNCRSVGIVIAMASADGQREESLEAEAGHINVVWEAQIASNESIMTIDGMKYDANLM